MITLEFWHVVVGLGILSMLWFYAIARDRFGIALFLTFASIFIPLALLAEVVVVRT